MFGRPKRDVPIPGLFVNFLAHFLIFAPKEQQRLSFANYDVFHLRNEDGMVPRLLRRMQPALQISQRHMQNGSAVLRALKARRGFLFCVLVRPSRPRIVFGNTTLLCAENINTEPLLGLKMGMSAC